MHDTVNGQFFQKTSLHHTEPTQATPRAERVTTFPANPFTTRNRQALLPELRFGTESDRVYQNLPLGLTTQIPLSAQHRVHNAVGEGSIPEDCLANPTRRICLSETNRKTATPTESTKHINHDGKNGSILHDVTTSVSPQHHVVVSNLTPGTWNSHDRDSDLTATLRTQGCSLHSTGRMKTCPLI